MSRLVAIGNLLQVAVYVGIAAWLWPRWQPAAGMAALGALLQLVAAGLTAAGRIGPARVASALTVAAGLGVLGMFVQSALHVATRFGPDATTHGQTALGLIALLSPWAVAFPAWQWLAGRRPGIESSTGLLGLAAAVGLGATLPAANAAMAHPDTEWPEQPALAEAASVAFTAWSRGEAVAPGAVGGEGPAAVLLTPWSDGVPGEAVSGRGATLGEAVAAALSRLPAPTGDRTALVVDLAREQWPAGVPTPPGRTGVLTGTGGRSPATIVQRGEVANPQVFPGWWVPAAPGDVVFDSVLVDESGARSLQNGWTTAPALDADQALAAAMAGGDMILANMQPDGRFTYIVRGPEGEPGKGYNFPRHAGTAWFLARLARRTGEARYQQGADAALAYLESHSRTVTTPDGQDIRWVRDPKRKDGRAWAGTTALAVLAAVDADSELALPWGRFLAASLDADGAVRGEVDEADGSFAEQPWNPYGQGQSTLALARLAQAHDEFREPALRAGRFMDGAYAPGGAARLVVLDEHWACLAASALFDLTGEPLGAGPCRGYLADSARRTPVPGSPLAIAAGPAGGLAEAVVSAAFFDPDGPHRERALAFGQHFLDSQYHRADAALLPAPERLVGGFRDKPWDLDVQIDAVQHVGCALLGIEELLSGERQPGSRP